MATYKFRIYCVTENTFVNGYGTVAPTVCYNNASHTVNLNGVNVVSEPVTVNIPISKYITSIFKTVMLDFNFSGSDIVGTPYQINLIISGASSATELSIIDVNNDSQTVASLTTATVDSPTSYTLTGGFISATPTIWELQAASDTSPIIQSIQIVYLN
jgi:hypothetical protein